MHNAHELDVSRWINRGESNTLAVKITPEQALQDINGVELADSWYDWINWKYLGYQGAGKNPANGNSFVADRNAGIWKPVYLRVSGAVVIGPSAVNSELPLPRTDSARLTIYSSLRNSSDPAGPWRSAGHNHTKWQARHPDRAAGHTRGRRATRDQLHPRRIRAAEPSRTPTSGGPTRSASPTSTTFAWSSGSTTAKPTPANCGSAFAPFLSTAIKTSNSPSSARAAISI